MLTLSFLHELISDMQDLSRKQLLGIQPCRLVWYFCTSVMFNHMLFSKSSTHRIHFIYYPQCSRNAIFPTHLQGRFASCSPEHTLLRIGGGGNTTSGPGGSGTAAWGVGKRGQLGHGNREDEALPKLLLGKIGYGIRIVQVAAGGGLVRVAHSLLLTSTGRVLSFGTAQYGQLGHGYDAGKQLSDCLRPRYIEALRNEKCVCVAAGELHSGAVTVDGACTLSWKFGSVAPYVVTIKPIRHTTDRVCYQELTLIVYLVLDWHTVFVKYFTRCLHGRYNNKERYKDRDYNRHNSRC